MSTKIKRVLAVLLSAVMVLSTVMVTPAAPLAGTTKYERPEPAAEDAVKTTGTWTKYDKGFWSLTVENRKVTDGWYYANMQNSSTEYGWFHFGANGAMSTGWVNDKKNPSIWYYMGETKDKTEGSLTTGWVTDPRDGKKYYMDPGNGQMSRGWKVINGVYYYFSDATREGHPDGSMYKNEKTPDGYYVGTTGGWRQSSGSSSGGSSRRNPDPTPTPTPTPIPTPDPVMTATASTTTPQHAGQQFNTDGLKIKVFKDGVEYKTVDLPDPSITITKVMVGGVENGILVSGSNDISIGFLYYDPAKPDVIIGQSMTTEVFIVEGNTYTVTFNKNGHGTETAPKTNVEYGSTIEAPATPTDAGYIFGGWYKEASCDNEWNFDSDTVTADTTLYAKWTEAIPTFTVNSSGDTVEFSPGLLYWDGSAFKFEENQYGFEGTWNASHVNHFYWSASPSVAIAETYDKTGRTETDTFFTEQSGFTVNGETGWRTLSNNEWSYLLKTRVVNGDTSYGKTCKWGTYSGVKGLIIAHDNYTGDFSDAAAAIADGCVFLPAAGYRRGTGMYSVGSYGYYWSSAPDENGVDFAYDLYFNDGYAYTTDSFGRNNGYCVRLVTE